MNQRNGINQAAGAPTQGTNGDSKGRRRGSPNLASIGPWASLVGLIVVFTVLNTRFLSVTNGLNIVRQGSVLLVLALSATFVVLMGSIDLSVGSVVSLSGMVAATMLRDVSEGAVFLALVMGAAVGALNGVLFAYGKLPSFLVTLGTLFAVQGVTSSWSRGIAVAVKPNLRISQVFNGEVFGFPLITLWALAALVVLILVARYTRFGRYMYAIGGGENVARLSGVPVERYKFLAFLLTGLIAGFGGMLLAFRINGGDPAMGESFLLPTIAAVVIGGTPLTGGVGGPHRTLLGVLIITILSNGMNLARVDAFLQNVVLGAVVLVATALTMDRSRLSMVK